METTGLRGPDGTTLAMAVTSDDDHRKETHDCEADYSLLVTRPGKQRQSLDFENSIDLYGRRLEVRAEGFSQDGKRFFGFICEGGSPALGESGKKNYPRPGADATLVEYRPDTDKLATFTLGKLVPYTAGCNADVLQVLGVTPDGRVVLMLKDKGVTQLWSIEMERMKAVALPRKPNLVPLNLDGFR